ncbi:Fe3+-hydroxamate ABC transporter permease FhuB [Actinobacillus succinogenes]|uniref:Transport system permease protein n=1 Tax=Actinobacillus succinogenes (strain ATCC 55618 / DSM 22257 / CCUG 43843 / 130Z) TaxID=339671 RepID=A6VN37_ACTSZ|nr:Fe(3+)-hydroxamate ABC transporter permease FhuB [Actinobacillus succinogenes]ABR74384.1 transport system permease protein [Actinobacillus succinogenes 130Z]PHI39194.1 Fe3+-hydroxamate ABC transporter permease FhuB [Actinobacillus succinogenes]
MVKKRFITFGALSFILFTGLLVFLLHSQLPATVYFTRLWAADDNLEILLINSYTLPRIGMAVLAGGLLGFASLLLQQVTANPLASDNTLGISSGAQFALFLCAIVMPEQLENGSAVIAVLGAAFSLILVLTLAMRKSMSPLLLILAGLVINLYFGAFSSMMMLFYPEESRGLAQWGAGSLVQESWRDSQVLCLQAIPACAIIALLIRPLTILTLNDANAQSLGVPVGKLRLIGVAVAAFLIAAVVSAVGMLGFLGLASATIVRQLGVRTLKGQLAASFVTGALLLGITDLCLQLLAQFKGISLPTGAVTALLGTPLLLWLMFRALSHTGRLQSQTVEKRRNFSPHFFAIILILLIISTVTALMLGQSLQGWHWLDIADQWDRQIFVLRYPRVLTALSVGILLAVAGVILQRLTLNPMASPELLGVSSGTTMGILAVIFLFSAQQTQWFWLAGILGALIALFILVAINQRQGMLPEKVLLTGISLSALLDTLQRLAIAGGDPRVNQLIAWTSGSTQNIHQDFALGYLCLSLLLLAASLIFCRWLELLALQTPMAQALGLNLPRTRWILIFFTAILTALATLIIGPLTFIGLLVPQITTLLGVKRVRNQLLISACLGGFIMMSADWLGRQILFPYEVPAGLVATLIGGTYFLLTVRKI